MENHLGEPIIIDFFGLPGSGKTTIAHFLSSKLREDGFQIQENIYEINNDYSSVKRLVVKIWYTFCFTIKNFSYLRTLFSMLGNGAFRNRKEAIKQWINICFVLSIINKVKKQDYIVADQGIVQAAISLTIHCEKANLVDVVRKLCEKVTVPILFVNIVADFSTNLTRLQIRKDGKSRVDFEKDDSKKKIQMQEIKLRCDEITKSFECIIVDNNSQSDTNNYGDILKTITGLHYVHQKLRS